MASRLEQKEKRREEILDAALDQFIRRGYAGTKIKDIADAAGMSIGLLFHYFESKENLYIELIKLGIAAPLDMVQGLFPIEPLDFFEACAEQTFQYAASSLFTAKMFVLMSNAHYSEGVPKEAHDLAVMSNSLYEKMVPLIQKGQKEGTIRQGNPLALSTIFWTAIQGSVEAYARNPELPLPQAEWIVDMIRA